MTPKDHSYPSDPADLFLRLFQDLDDQAVTADLVAEWVDDDNVIEFAEYVYNRAVNIGEFDPDDLVAEVDEYPGDVDERRYAFLLGLDQAFARIHPANDSSDQGGQLMPLLSRMRRTGVFNTTHIDGAVLPRFARPPRLELTDPPDWESKGELFEYVTCVAGEAWADARSVRIPRHTDLPASVHLDGVTVGCAPVCGRKDVDVAPTTCKDRPAYAVSPRSDGVPMARVRHIIKGLDEGGAQIGVMPELTLTPLILGRWQEALRAMTPTHGSRLRIIMVGSGPMAPMSDERVVNRAVLLSRYGDVIGFQDKRHGFTLTTEQIGDWGLVKDLGADEHRMEPLQRGTLLTFFESVGGRLCTLVCEDLGRPVQDGTQLLGVGPSIIMAPVLSKPTLMYHWEHSDAQKLAASIGASTIVANSLIVTDAMKEAGLGREGELGTALAQGGVNGQAVSDAVDDPGDLVLFRVTPEETVVVRRIDHDG